MESATIWNLKPESWGTPLVEEEKYQGKGNLWQRDEDDNDYDAAAADDNL
jgi:hypothetical protein